MTPIKVRKLLITSGAYQTPISQQINELYSIGKIIKELQQVMGLSVASVNGYLPYQKTVYYLEVSTDMVSWLRKYRFRKAMTDKISSEVEMGTEHAKDLLLQIIIAFENYSFKIFKGIRYYYTVKDNEIFFLRKGKFVTRASVDITLEQLLEFKRGITKSPDRKCLDVSAQAICTRFLSESV